MLYKNLKPFPKDFLWGASLEDGKGPSCQDVKIVPKGTSDLTVCADHYHHYKEDVALMAEKGCKSYVFPLPSSDAGNGRIPFTGIKR